MYQTKGKCIACFFEGEIDLHHIRSRGAGGEDTVQNLMPLCRSCHQAIHKLGRTKFIKEKNLEKWMEARGWKFEDFAEKWISLDKDGWQTEG